MAVSGCLAAAKILIGLLAHSTSVFADGVESASDVLASGIIMFGLSLALKPADENHPYGHGRFEILSGLGVGFLLGITGVAICVSAYARIDEPHPVPAAYAMWPLLVSITAKASLSAVKFHYGRKLHSAALRADAYNDSVDILSATVALAALAFTLSDPVRFAAADHYGGMAVGVIVIFLGLQVTRETSLQLMDTMPDFETMRRIREVAYQVAGARAVEKCYARKTGMQYHVDLHLEVDPQMTVLESHYIAHQVQEKIKKELDWVADVLVHVEPHGREG
jgi:cation diffusion facilitator family transporter